jgi:hypothetical protein
MTCSRSSISPRWMRNKPCSSTMNIEGIEIVAPVGADPASALTWYNASVTYRANDPDSGSDSPCSPIPPPISSIHSLRSACLHHSCSCHVSFLFSDSFFWFSHVPYVISIPFQDCSTIYTSCIYSPSLQSWNRLDFRFPLSSRARPRSSSPPMLLLPSFPPPETCRSVSC